MTITYSFPDAFSIWSTDPNIGYGPITGGGEPWSGAYRGLDASEQAAVRSALQAWSDVANITFVETTETQTNVGDLRFAFTASPGEAAHAYYPNSAPVGGDVWLNVLEASNRDLASGYGRLTLIHEIGHTLGLEHSFDHAGALPSALDDHLNTVMSYSDGPGGVRGADRYPTTPMPVDILAAQYLYGANTSYHTGDDVYRFDAAGAYEQTIWDAGGNDTIAVSGASAVSIDLHPGAFSHIGQPLHLFDGSVLPNTVAIAYGATIENASGGAGNDTLIGNSVANLLSGGGGADRLVGGDGNDTLDGGAGADVLSGGSGDDTYVVDDPRDSIIESASGGTDTVIASVSYVLGANLENLILSGGADLSGTGNAQGNALTGNAGANTLIGGAGNDSLSGGDGNDRLFGQGGADTIDGGAGNDTVSYSASPTGVAVDLATGTGSGGDAQGDVLSHIENLVGSTFGDTLTGDAGANRLGGGGGNDLLSGGAGADVLNGGDGWDTASYDGASAGVTVSLLTGLGSGGDAQGDQLIGIECLVGSAFADTLVGDIGVNRLSGGAGDDVLKGSWGDDVLLGGAGADTLNGGVGYDTASYADSPAGVTVSLAAGSPSGGDAQGDVLIGIEGLAGSSFNDTLTGDGGANRLAGGAGDDLLVGGAGADMLVGGLGNDTASYESSATGVIVNLATGTGSGGDAQGDVLSGVENLIGSALADRLNGDGGANQLDGGAGNDVLIGGPGADTLIGGAGSDTASYAGSPAGVAVNLATGVASGGDAAGDVLVSIENLAGSSFADVLTGDGGANRLSGAGGSDVLIGGGGADILVGGPGSDRFVFNALSESTVGAPDQILDFSRADGDKIDLHGIDADNIAAGDQAFTFIGSAGFGHVAGQLHAIHAGAATLVEGDVDGDGIADFQIRLTGSLSLKATDFFL